MAFSGVLYAQQPKPAPKPMPRPAPAPQPRPTTAPPAKAAPAPTATKSTVTPTTAKMPTDSVDKTLELRRAINRAVNGYRKENNLRELGLRSKVSAIAQQHSEDMAAGRVPFSHEGFTKRFAAIEALISEGVGYEIAENLYAQTKMSPNLAAAALKAWKNSKGHNATMLNPVFFFSGVGIAVSASGEVFVTQLFVGKKDIKDVKNIIHSGNED